MQGEDGEMPNDISPMTGEAFYSGSWEDVKEMRKTLR